MQGLGSWQTLDTSMGRWYRSKETIAGKNPYFGYLSNKRWPLNEAITMHLMYFAQVSQICQSRLFVLCICGFAGWINWS